MALTPPPVPSSLPELRPKVAVDGSGDGETFEPGIVASASSMILAERSDDFSSVSTHVASERYTADNLSTLTVLSVQVKQHTTTDIVVYASSFP